jgi:hypothetical protein
MKTSLTFALLITLSACAYRSPEMYRDDTGKVLESKNGEIKACYDGFLKGNQGAGGKVTVNFEVETEAGKIQNVTIDKANTTAPAELGACVKKSIEGLAVSPPDRKTGQGTWVYEFSQPPATPAPAPAAPAPAAAPAPKS